MRTSCTLLSFCLASLAMVAASPIPAPKPIINQLEDIDHQGHSSSIRPIFATRNSARQNDNDEEEGRLAACKVQAGSGRCGQAELIPTAIVCGGGSRRRGSRLFTGQFRSYLKGVLRFRAGCWNMPAKDKETQEYDELISNEDTNDMYLFLGHFPPADELVFLLQREWLKVLTPNFSNQLFGFRASSTTT
ncbi:hypothetical protein BKA70DRAFT_1242322 [Coprinopsis sp. MPI-PUGE-AT-0042]|nr:hypothetical protein BKA70DRAFT_1242322 [Coprinopsis sp. MPI-PUGE-AT-0042]